MEKRIARLEDAAEVADYLADLGVTHAYSSPLLRSAEGSNHGYDTVDYETIESDYGTNADAETIRDTAVAQPLLVASGMLAALALFPHPADAFGRIGAVATPSTTARISGEALSASRPRCRGQRRW